MERNVAGIERIASIVLGGLSLTQALNSNRSAATKAAAGSMGLALLWRGATGSCPLYKTLDFATYHPNSQVAPQLLERSALVNLPIDEVRSFLEMEETPYGLFDSGNSEDEFQVDIDDRTWTLALSPHADRERTLIKVSWTYKAPMALSKQESKGILNQLKKEATTSSRMLEIRKLKALMETGEIATVEGQTHGERSSLGTFMEHFGEFILEKIQSRTALPTQLETKTQGSLNDDLYPKRKVQA